MDKDTGRCLFKYDKKTKENILNFSYKYLIGTDEAGRGPGAGPVYAAAVCFTSVSAKLIKKLSLLNDSKQIKENVREDLYNIIIENSIYSVNSSDEKIIDEINIYNATSNAMKKSCEDIIEKLEDKNVITLVDGKVGIKGYRYPQSAVIKGDAHSASIAAASILAKVTRDKFMINLSKEYPKYNWDKNKGYLTKDHIDAIKKYGITPYHRISFLKNILENTDNDSSIQTTLCI